MLVNLSPGYSSPQFQRKPNANEMKRYTEAVSQGLRVLDKNMGLIVHNSSVPSIAKQNIGIGSLLSKAAQKAFLPFVAFLGFNTIQQEPDNIRSTFIPSPYSPQSSSKNTFMIPIERLATEEYGYLLNKEDLESITTQNLDNKDKVNFPTVTKNFDDVLAKAYFALVGECDEHLLEGVDKNARIRHIQLQNEFKDYKDTNKEELEPNAIYEALAKSYNNENWKTWNEPDRNLYTNSDAKYLRSIRKRFATNIDLHIFKQWLVEREIAKANARNEKIDLKVIGDSPIAFTPVEEWRNQDLFMKNWALGCPPDYFSKDGQRWGFAVLKPETIFNPDGSLGKGGELMQKRYEKMFASSPGGARIDHIIGLIDPFVYRTDKPNMDGNNSGRLYSSPNHPVLGKYAKYTEDQYAEILEKIVFPAAEKYGLTKHDIICEDLGTLTDPVKNIMRNRNLTGIAITQYDYRGKNTPAKNVIMPGSHDNESFIEYTNKIFNDKNHLGEKAHKLGEDTIVPGENWNSYIWDICTNKTKFSAASFTELFTSPAKKIQLFFTTLFGIGKTYNKPGTTEDCWTLRLPENYEEIYWENVKKGTAPNIPDSIARAIRHKGNDFANKHRDLLSNLDEMSNILKS